MDSGLLGICSLQFSSSETASRSFSLDPHRRHIYGISTEPGSAQLPSSEAWSCWERACLPGQSFREGSSLIHLFKHHKQQESPQGDLLEGVRNLTAEPGPSCKQTNANKGNNVKWLQIIRRRPGAAPPYLVLRPSCI